MNDDTKASDLIILDGKLQRRCREDNKEHPKLLGDAFRRDEHGEIRFDGTTTPRRSVLQNSKTLVASGLVLDGNTSVEAEDMSNDLRAQPRKPVFESDAVRAAMGLPTSTPEAATPKDEPINPLFPNAKQDSAAEESPRAKSRRELRTPTFDSDTVRNGAPATPKDSAGDARAKAQQASRTPVFDAGPGALLPKSTKGKLL